MGSSHLGAIALGGQRFGERLELKGGQVRQLWEGHIAGPLRQVLRQQLQHLRHRH